MPQHLPKKKEEETSTLKRKSNHGKKREDGNGGVIKTIHPGLQFGIWKKEHKQVGGITGLEISCSTFVS